MDLLIDILGTNVTPYEELLVRNSFILLISLPIVATLTGFFRHIVGLKSLSVYAPIVITFTFYQLGEIHSFDSDIMYSYTRGVQFGLILYTIVFLASTLIYMSIKRMRMHYIPKTTIVMIGVALSIIFAVILGTVLFDKKGLIYLDIFPILMILTLSDTFVSSLSRKSFLQTTVVGLQTVLIGLIAYTIISIPEVQDLAIEYTITLILVLLLINLYIGKFVGLRLSEYYRFRDLLLEETNGKRNRKNQKK